MKIPLKVAGIKNFKRIDLSQDDKYFFHCAFVNMAFTNITQEGYLDRIY